MNQIDKNMEDFIKKIKSLKEKELTQIIKYYYSKVNEKTKESMENFFKKFPYWGELDYKNNSYQEIEKKAECLYHHIDDFVWVYHHLEDYRSKALLYSILHNWYCYDFLMTSKTKEYLYDDYFDYDILTYLQDEVFVDLGAYVGDTIESFIKNYGKIYKKIYAYEITPSSYQTLLKNTEKYKNIICNLKGISNKMGSMKLIENMVSPSANTLEENGSILVTTLDEDVKEKITMIKMDIEGMEYEALKGAEKHIRKDKPKLLISVYHKNEDLFRIPKLIYEYSKDYHFYLRYTASPIYPTEITLFAVTN